MRPIPKTPDGAGRAYFVALLRSRGQLFEAMRLELAGEITASQGYATQLADYFESGRNE